MPGLEQQVQCPNDGSSRTREQTNSVRKKKTHNARTENQGSSMPWPIKMGGAGFTCPARSTLASDVSARAPGSWETAKSAKPGGK